MHELLNWARLTEVQEQNMGQTLFFPEQTNNKPVCMFREEVIR
jgi:hypothetical protein